MSTVADTKVTTDTRSLTVSTVKLGFRYYDTVIFDDSPDRRHAGKTVGRFVIDNVATHADTRDEAMDVHREAVHAARVEDIR